MSGWYRVNSAEGPHDEVFVSGFRVSQQGNADYITAKYTGIQPSPPTANKQPNWVVFYPPGAGTSSLHDVAASNCLLLYQSGEPGANIFVTGRSDGGASHDDFLTIRYRDVDP
jgi:hypothetical protein